MVGAEKINELVLVGGRYALCRNGGVMQAKKNAFLEGGPSKKAPPDRGRGGEPAFLLCVPGGRDVLGLTRSH